MFWLFASVVVLSLLTAFILLLRVRVEDSRRAEIIAAERDKRLGEQAITISTGDKRLEEARYAYAMKQLEFAQACLHQVAMGRFKEEDIGDLIAACTRQLNGVPPPHDANPIAVRKPGSLDLEVRHF